MTSENKKGPQYPARGRSNLRGPSPGRGDAWVMYWVVMRLVTDHRDCHRDPLVVVRLVHLRQKCHLWPLSRY